MQLESVDDQILYVIIEPFFLMSKTKVNTSMQRATLAHFEKVLIVGLIALNPPNYYRNCI